MLSFSKLFPRGCSLALGFRISLNNAFQCVLSTIVALVSPGNNSEKCTFSGPGHKPIKSKTLGVGPSTLCFNKSYWSAVPSLFGTRDQFHGRQLFHGGCGGVWRMVQAVMWTMGDDGEQQVKLRSLICRSPPAVQPASYRATARGLGTPPI